MTVRSVFTEDSLLHVESFRPEHPDIREVMRYAGGGEPDPDMVEMIDECCAELLPRLAYKVCWRYFPIAFEDGKINLGFVTVESGSLARNLAGCRGIVLFAATLGLAPDRMMARYGRISPARALFCQAVGAERIEALCDMFCAGMEDKYGPLRPRFSPGYGDLPLELQKDIFRVLDCPRSIGLTLTGSLLMSPAKSVTAIVGCKGASVGAGMCC